MPDKPRVHAIGGIFFRSNNPEASRNWYKRHLGLNVDEYGTNFVWREEQAPQNRGYTQWSAFEHDTTYFGSADQQFMLNYRVDDLETLVEVLREDGVKIVGEIMHEAYGKFAHVIDGDGRRVELWEPIDTEYKKMLDGVTK